MSRSPPTAAPAGEPLRKPVPAPHKSTLSLDGMRPPRTRRAGVELWPPPRTAYALGHPAPQLLFVMPVHSRALAHPLARAPLR
eukprot:scaffold80322_cov26-Tisochrysis_lutea.AAC.3